ncbi:hypothetical protein CHS0354_034838 [Potamilus streckersoni]|uniref:Uncharacterized protein n=1 Tax=Potamilus streckersoni TaxID=2493646 RepID=A0AAE0TJG8_9BIVA|nr:hypothetical protein CHS0354_034838 [Potamilus streckersoni]
MLNRFISRPYQTSSQTKGVNMLASKARGYLLTRFTGLWKKSQLSFDLGMWSNVVVAAENYYKDINCFHQKEKDKKTLRENQNVAADSNMMTATATGRVEK